MNHYDDNRFLEYSIPLLQTPRQTTTNKFDKAYNSLITDCKFALKIRKIIFAASDEKKLLQTVFNEENISTMPLSKTTIDNIIEFIYYYQTEKKNTKNVESTKNTSGIYTFLEYQKMINPTKSSFNRYFNHIVKSNKEYEFIETILQKHLSGNISTESRFLYTYYCALKELNQTYANAHIPIDGLTVINNHNNGYNKNNRIIIESEIAFSSYFSKKIKGSLNLQKLNLEELKNLQKQCMNYATTSITNSVWKPGMENDNNSKYLIRRMTAADSRKNILETLDKREYVSSSIITPENTSTFYGVYPVIFGFSDISPEQIFHIFPFDSAANQHILGFTNTPNFMLDIDDLTKRTAINQTYNQLTIYTHNVDKKVIKPSYVLIRDNEHQKESEKTAKELEIPVVHVKTLKYRNDKDIILPYV